MSSQYLFAYGTLKSDQPEHTRHCVPPISITKARASGTLWRLREGYPILQINPTLSVLDATPDIVADWNQTIKATNKPPATSTEFHIEGELFEYPLTSNALQKMDAWENFTPGVKSPYQRRAIWIQDPTEQYRIAWAYVCYSPPNWAVMLSEQSW